jgi:hypothetical protein
MHSEASPKITIDRLLRPHLLVIQYCPILLKRHRLCELQEIDHRLEFEKRAFPAKLVLPEFTGVPLCGFTIMIATSPSPNRAVSGCPNCGTVWLDTALPL